MTDVKNTAIFDKDFTAESLCYIAVFQFNFFDSVVMSNTRTYFKKLIKISELETEVLNQKCLYKFDEFKISSKITIYRYLDTVIFTSNGNTNMDCLAMLEACSAFYVGCVSLNVLLTGYVSFGQFYLDTTRKIFCGKPYVYAKNMATTIQLNALVCDKIVVQNLNEARMYIRDNNMFSKMGYSLIDVWNVPIYGETLMGGLVKKEMSLIDWPRLSMELFQTVKFFSVEEFFQPYECEFGKFEDVDDIVRDYFTNSVEYINSCLKQSVNIMNSTF